jgi:hypothetical protein
MTMVTAMDPNDLPRYHGASVWVTLDGNRTAMRLVSKPPHDPYIAKPEKGEPEDLLPPSVVVLTTAQIETLSVADNGSLESDIVITRQPASPSAQEDIC